MDMTRYNTLIEALEWHGYTLVFPDSPPSNIVAFKRNGDYRRVLYNMKFYCSYLSRRHDSIGDVVDALDEALGGCIVETEKAERPTQDEYFLKMAELVSTRATCARRKVGCVLVNSRKHILATGYNGVASGMPHCIDEPCPGANYPSGEGLDKCEAIHAEQNAFASMS